MKYLPGLIVLLSVWLSSFPGWAAEPSPADGNGKTPSEQSGSGSGSEKSTQGGSGQEEEPDCE